MDRLIRETQPPAGSYPSPVPQYWNPATGQYERVYGQGGANRVQLYAHDGTTLLPVKVDSEGRLVLAQEVSVGDVTVNVGPLGEVQLSGRNAKVQRVVLAEAPLSDGYLYGPVTDLTQTDIAAVALYVASDQPVQVQLRGDAGGNVPSAAQAGFWAQLTYVPGVNERALLIPWHRPILPRYYWVFTVMSDTPQTYCYIAELRSPVEYFVGANLKAWLAYGLAIRDTAEHTVNTDPNHLFSFRRLAWAGAKSPIWIRSTLDQAVEATVRLVAPPLNAAVGTIEIPAGQSKVITNQDFPALDVPYEQLRIDFQCKVAPTTGTVDALCDSVMGGLA